MATMLQPYQLTKIMMKNKKNILITVIIKVVMKIRITLIILMIIIVV